MTTPTRRPLMIIDDDDDLRKALTLILSTYGYEVSAFGDARAGAGRARGRRRSRSSSCSI